MNSDRQPPPVPVNPSDGSTVEPVRLRLVPQHQRPAAAGKVIGRTNAGAPTLAGIALPDCRHHVHVLGPTGTGKTTLMLRMILGDVAAGRGTAVFDPSAKGDFVRDLLDRLPETCADRLVVIDPDEPHPPALNLVDPATAASPYQVAAHLTTVMARVWWRWWGHRTADLAYHAVLTLAHLPGTTLADLPRLLADRAWRGRKVRQALQQPGVGATVGEFWEGFDALPPGARAAHTAPLLSKLRLVLSHPFARALFGTPATTLTLSDILDGGVMLVRLPKGVVGEDGCRLIGSLLLAGLWQATTARATQPEAQRLDAGVYLDECQNFLHLPIGVAEALAESRGLRVSFTLAHQYLAQLTPEMAAAIDANARNKAYFTLSPSDADEVAGHVRPWLDAADLARLAGFEAVLRPIAASRPLPPFTLNTLPPPDPQPGRAVRLRAAAADRTGLSPAVRERLSAQQAITIPADQPPAPPAGEPTRTPPGDGFDQPAVGYGDNPYPPEPSPPFDEPMLFEEPPWTTWT